MQQADHLEDLATTPLGQRESLGQFLEKGLLDRLHQAVGTHQVSRQGQGRFSLRLLQRRNGCSDQARPAVLTQLLEQGVKEVPHLLVGLVLEGCSKFKLGPQGMGLIATQLAIAADSSQANGSKGFRSVHRGKGVCSHCSRDWVIRHPVGMPFSARFCIATGALALATSVVNQVTAPQLDPALERSSVLASFLAVGLMLIGVLWTRVVPKPPSVIALQGKQGMAMRHNLSKDLADELNWGSRMLLTATPAAVLLVWHQGDVLLRRGLVGDTEELQPFNPGAICQQSLDKQRQIHLVDLKHYPGRHEFEPLLADLPSVIVQPLGPEGLVLLGGSAPRCFSSGDLVWLQGWAERLNGGWLTPEPDRQSVGVPDGSWNAPWIPEP